MSTWMVVLVVVVVVAIAVAVVAGVRHKQRRRSTSDSIGLPPLGALSADEPVVGSGSSVPAAPADERADEQLEQPRRR